MTYFYNCGDISTEELFDEKTNYSKYIFAKSSKSIDSLDVKFIINNKKYRCCYSTHKDGNIYIGVEEIHILESCDIADDYTSNITCPYCGYADGNSWESDDSEDNYICPNCGSIFSYERQVTVEYYCSPVKKNNCFVIIE